jgi:hypothetical protein
MNKNRPREEPFTYHQHALATLNEERGGRYTNKALGPVVTGADPPPKIESPGPWSTPDGVPDEEPLGVDISIAPDIGEPPEQPHGLPSMQRTAEGGEPERAPASPTAVERARTIPRRGMPS